MDNENTALVSARGLKKSYPAEVKRARADLFAGLMRALATGGKSGIASGERFVALKDVSFELRAGESLGVIGRNGSGKSTLMKVIAGVLKADEGALEVNGQLQALINLGAGFDRQLSGLENVRTVASLYGVAGPELEQLVSKVEEFSELGGFLEKPIETYSSGMAARLGFSLCVHLDPDILIIDEALSVGDGAFQNKCLLKLEELRRRGLSLLLVSHSMAHVLQFCQTSIWLDRGEVIAAGPTKAVVKAYTDWLAEGAEVNAEKRAVFDRETSEEVADGAAGRSVSVAPAFDFSSIGQVVVKSDQAKFHVVPFRPKRIRIEDAEVQGRVISETYGPLHAPTDGLRNIRCSIINPVREDMSPRTNEPLIIDYEFYWGGEALSALNVSLHIYKDNGVSVTTVTTLQSSALDDVSRGWIRRRVEIDDLCLNPGRYVIMMPVHEGRAYLSRGVCGAFQVKSEVGPTFGQINLNCRYVVDIERQS